MAENLDSLEHLLSCQVCFHEFQEDGEHIPRLLPCTHTLCESCIGQLIRNNRLECPECRKTHDAEDVKSFPQNKYLLTQLRRKSEEVALPGVELCKERKTELILFCLEGTCQKAICISCLNEKHRRHDVTGIEGGQKEVLAKKFSIVDRNLKNKIAVLYAAKNAVEKKAETCKLDLQKAKEEIDKHFTKMVEEVEQREKDSKQTIDAEIDAVSENITFLENLKSTADEVITNTKDTTMNTFEAMMELKENINWNLSGDRNFLFLGYEPNEPLSHLVGSLREDHIIVHLPSITEPSTPGSVVMRNVTDVSQLQCKVTKTIETGLARIGEMILLSNDTIICSGAENETEKLKQFSLLTGDLLCSMNLSAKASGKAEVEIAGRPTLAMSMGNSIQFHDPENLTKIIHIHSEPQSTPEQLSVSGSSVLHFVSDTKIYQLDCSNLESLQSTKSCIIDVSEGVWYVCCAQQNNKEFILVVPRSLAGIKAYDANSGNVEWEKEIPGMMRCALAPDGHGHLFLSDKNNECVHLLSLLDGQHLGCLIKTGEQGVGFPAWVAWSDETSSLILAHGKKNKRFISFINIQ